MIKDVFIDIIGIQNINDDEEKVEFSTEARFGTKNGDFFISYNDGQMLEDKADIKTRLFIKSDNSIVLERRGAVNSRMLIEKDKRNTAFYSTPLGELDISIYGEEIDVNLNEKGGELFFAYTIDSGLKLLSRNTVKISVKEAQ